MSSTAVEKKNSNGKTPSDQLSPIPALGVEQGVDSSLPFTTPFNPMGLGLVKSPAELMKQGLMEVLKDEYGVSRPSVHQLTTMRRLDGHARALYRLLTLPIRASLATATFKPADGGDAEAKFMEDVFRTAPSNGGMTSTFQRFMGQLLGALFEGFSCFEKVFWIPENGPLEGKITLQKLAYRPADTVTFVADKNGGFAGFRQRAVVAGKATDVFIEPEYAFYYAAQEDERKFYGVSFFESAFPHYDAKAKAYFTAHIAAQRAAVGTRIGTVPPNASLGAKQEFAKNLGNLAMAQWMMVPEGFKVEVLKEGGNFDFLNLINHHNHMMSESILANFFDKDSGGGSGEAGALVNFAQPGDDMFILMLRAIMDDLANSINHYIVPQLIDYNFKGSKYPTFTWGAFTDEQRQAIASTFDKLATAGQSANVSKEFMRELEKSIASEMGLTIDWEEVEAREAEEKAAADAQMAGAAGGVDPAAMAPVTDADLGTVESLSDVIGLMSDRVDQAVKQQGAGGQNPTDPATPGAKPPAGGAAPKVEPDVPPIAKPKKVVKQVKLGQHHVTEGLLELAGITPDIMDWAGHMMALTAGEDWSDG